MVPAPTACACCGLEKLSKIGEDVTETLEVIPRRWKVIQTVREKFTCRHLREDLPAAGAVPHDTPGLGGSQPAGDDRLREVRPAPAAQPPAGPLRARGRRSQPVGPWPTRWAPARWRCGRCTTGSQRMCWRRSVCTAMTRRCRCWPRARPPPRGPGSTVRDDAPFGGPDPPAALFRYSRDRSGDHPVEHLRNFTGILQADIYAGYNRLYAAGRSPGSVTEAACWSHSRRKCFELADIAASKGRGENAPPISPLALEAVKRIDALFDIERGINGKPTEQRLAVRQELSAPVLADLKGWMQAAHSAGRFRSTIDSGRSSGASRPAVFRCASSANGATATPANGTEHTVASTGNLPPTDRRAYSISPPTTSRSTSPDAVSDRRRDRHHVASGGSCPPPPLRRAPPPIESERESRGRIGEDATQPNVPETPGRHPLKGQSDGTTFLR